MTNTKFRKRALLSSVAMLLVALVALGSATFAWFVDDPNAHTSGLNAKTNASTGLLIATDTDGGLTSFAHTKALGKDKDNIILVPATTKNYVNYYTAEAAKSDESNIAVGTGKKWKAAGDVDAANGTGVYHETIALKATTAPAAGKKFALTINGATLNTNSSNALAPGATVIIVDATNNLKACFNTSGNDVATWGGTAFETNSVFADTTDTNGDAIDATAATGNVNIALADITEADTAVNFEVYVFLDGYNDAVKSTNATSAANLISSLVLDFNISEVNAA